MGESSQLNGNSNGSASPAPPPEDSGKRSEGIAACGLSLPWGSGKLDATDFAARLQRMLLTCKSMQDKQGIRYRIFDNCTVTEKLENGPEMSLTESRCTLFRRLREIAKISEDAFYNTMCSKPFSGGKVEVSGKSGSLFLRSHDNELVLKTIEEHEFEVLNSMLPHMMLYFEQNRNSLLSRFFGAYALTVGGQTMRIVAMTNVLKRPVDTIYDLKGTTEDRWVDPKSGGVLKDRNFTYTMLFDFDRRQELVQTIVDDADFLDSVGVMDYSLLLGVRQPNSMGVTKGDISEMPPNLSYLKGILKDANGAVQEVEFQLGIIDFLQCWTPKKIAAHWLKKSTIGCFHEIDTEPPAKYRQRFCKYFLSKIESVSGRPIRTVSFEGKEPEEEE
mmetsp:Transcript_43168/g.92389  ORF Transcript_43168/g.92389 Transcript_43168/m.92389 type:complete len:388 (-) Transcript_43168:225-1388(-)